MSDKTWKVTSLVVDNYIRNRNKRIEQKNPSMDDVISAIASLDGTGRSSLAVMGNDDSVVCVGGGGAQGFYVSATFRINDEDEVYSLSNSKKESEQEVDIILGSQSTSLPKHLVMLNINDVEKAVKYYFSNGSLDKSLIWIKS